MLQCDILIVGAGASGMTAAVAACEAGCNNVFVIDSSASLGGILMQCHHNGFGAGKSGPEYSLELKKRFCSCNVKLSLETEVVKIDFNKTALLSTKTGLMMVSFKTLILATGCMEVPFGALGISGTRPDGIYSAGFVQRQLNINDCFPDDDIVVLGCGDLGMILSGTLASVGKNVICIIEKNNTYSGLLKNYRNYIETNHIKVIYNSTVAEISGNNRVEAIILNNSKRIKCRTLIVAAGLIPDRQLVNHLGEQPWIKFCGNCSKVHTVIESVINESELVGKAAAMEFLK